MKSEYLDKVASMFENDLSYCMDADYITICFKNRARDAFLIGKFEKQIKEGILKVDSYGKLVINEDA